MEKSNIKVSICCIIKMENNYIREWVEHYKMIGADNVIIYDNNDKGGENPNDVIGDYIDSGFVILENCRGKIAYQCGAYISCFRKYKEKYDWIAFFDADEFLDVENIKEFLSNDTFLGFDCIRVPWKVFTDDGLVFSNGNYSIKRFKTYIPSIVCKSIVNTKSKSITGISPHGPLNVNACDPNGDKCKSKDLYMNDFLPEKMYNVWLNHYMFKTIEEYVTHKMVRLYPDQTNESAKTKITLKRFFSINEITKEKIDYLSSIGANLSFLSEERMKLKL